MLESLAAMVGMPDRRVDPLRLGCVIDAGSWEKMKGIAKSSQHVTGAQPTPRGCRRSKGDL